MGADWISCACRCFMSRSVFRLPFVHPVVRHVSSRLVAFRRVLRPTTVNPYRSSRLAAFHRVSSRFFFRRKPHCSSRLVASRRVFRRWSCSLLVFSLSVLMSVGHGEVSDRGEWGLGPLGGTVGGPAGTRLSVRHVSSRLVAFSRRVVPSRLVAALSPRGSGGAGGGWP